MKPQSTKLVKFLMVLTLISSAITMTYVQVLVGQIRSTREKIWENANKISFELEIDRGESVKIQADLFFPKNMDPEKSYPLVACQHGMGGRKESHQSLAYSFVNRGFVVLTMMLRDHYGSTGHTTVGNQESYDLLDCISHSKKLMTEQGITIDKVGLVGHSLGALTVTLAAIRGNLNSCVAIAPPSDITGLAEMSLGLDLQKQWSKVSGYNDFSDPDFVQNITLLGQTPPKNYLMIAGDGDELIDPSWVEKLLYDYTNNESAQPFTHYGTFQNNTALEYKIFDVASHGSEQFAHEEPEIANAAIEWTEKALNISNSEPIDVLDAPHLMKFKGLYDNWGRLQTLHAIFAILFFCFVVLGLRFYHTNQKPMTPENSQGFNHKNHSEDMRNYNYFFSEIIALWGIMEYLIPKYADLIPTDLLLGAFSPVVVAIVFTSCLDVLLRSIRKKTSNPPKKPRLSQQSKKNAVLARGTFEFSLGLITAFICIYSLAIISQQAGGEAIVKVYPHSKGTIFAFVHILIASTFLHWGLKRILNKRQSRSKSKNPSVSLKIKFLFLTLTYGVIYGLGRFGTTTFGPGNVQIPLCLALGVSIWLIVIMQFALDKLVGSSKRFSPFSPAFVSSMFAFLSTSVLLSF